MKLSCPQVCTGRLLLGQDDKGQECPLLNLIHMGLGRLHHEPLWKFLRDS